MSVSVFAERLRNAMRTAGDSKQVDLVHAAEHRGVKMGKSHISQGCGRQDHAPRGRARIPGQRTGRRHELAARRGIHHAIELGRIQQRHGRRTRRHTACHGCRQAPDGQRDSRGPPPHLRQIAQARQRALRRARPGRRRGDAHGGQRHPHPEIEHRQPGTLRLPHAGRSGLRHGPPAHRHRRLLAVQGPVLRAQGHRRSTRS